MWWQQVRPSEGRPMPWKNGGGTTLELAVEPPGATLASGFHWRISSAEVGVSGPFSLFPGLERWLLLLAGAGFGIDFGDRGQADLTEALAPLFFSGDWPAIATLVDGPITDFNLMVNPRSHRARLQVIELNVSRALPLRAPTTLLFVARGTVCVPALGLHLGHRHLFRIEAGTGALILAPGLAGAVLIWIELSPV